MSEDASTPNKSVQEILNKTLDRTVDPYVVQVGMLAKTSAGSWVTVKTSADGSLSNGDASNFRVSSIGGSSAAISASGSSISAVQSDAGILRVSSIQGDAGLFRVSAVGTLTVSSHEVKQSDAAALLISAKQGDAGLLRVSAIAALSANQQISAVLLAGTANIGYVSATIDNGSISAKQGTYPWSVSGNISAALNEGANFLGQVSAIIKNYPLVVSGTVSAFINQGTVSAYSPDASLFRVSSFPGYVALNISSVGITTVKGTKGILHTININDSLAKTIKIYQSSATTGTIIASIDAPTKGNVFVYDIITDTGITISALSASNLTVTYV